MGPTVERMPEDVEHPADQDTSPRGGATRLSPGRLVAGAIALLAIIGIVLGLVLRGGGHRTQRAPASGVSTESLNAFASSIGHPIYWVGPQPSFTYELSRTKDGRVYIRYLPRGVKVGNANPNYLTVGTYPQRNAFATLRATVEKQGAHTITLAGGGLAFQYTGRPTSVYLAYPGLNYQVEVFDPSPTRALGLVTSGQVKPVGAPPRTPAGSKAASLQELKALAATLGHPLYWAGPRPVDTYELTRTRDGSVYIRYLPAGVPIGDRRPNYLTVGTYPLKNALQALTATAASNHISTIKLGKGGLAFVDTAHPTSVYLAYPNVDVQVEVYDPAAGVARQLVAAGQITGVG